MSMKRIIYCISAAPSVSLVALLLWVGSLDAPVSRSPHIVHVAEKQTVKSMQEAEVEKREVREVPITNPQKSIFYSVPFTSQAPTSNWDDIRQQNACEEASALMAMAWVTGELLPDADSVVEKLLIIDAYEKAQYGAHLDTSAADTMEYILKGYFEYEKVSLEHVESI